VELITILDNTGRNHPTSPTFPAQTRPCPIIWSLFLLLRCISSFAPNRAGVDPTVHLQQWRSPWQVVQYTIQARRTVRSARRIIRLNQLPALVLDRTRRNSALCHWGIHVGLPFNKRSSAYWSAVETSRLSNNLNAIRRPAIWSKPRASCSVWLT
jgi:hypothetical protein